MNDLKCTCWNPARSYDIGCPKHRAELLAWRDTTLIEADPDLLSRITDPGHEQDHRALPRPDYCCGGGCATCG